MSERQNDDFVLGTPAERIAMVWPLTCEALSLSERYDTQQPMQRHVVRVIRPGGRIPSGHPERDHDSATMTLDKPDQTMNVMEDIVEN